MRSAYIVSVVCYKVARLRKPGKYLQLWDKVAIEVKISGTFVTGYLPLIWNQYIWTQAVSINRVGLVTSCNPFTILILGK